MDTGGDPRPGTPRAGPGSSAGTEHHASEADRSWVLRALDEHEGRLTRYAHRLTGDLHAARDVVQHVFLQLCDHPPQSRNGQLTSWLFTVCHNRAMDVRRRGGRAGSLEQVPAESLGSDVDDPARTAEAGDSVELLRSVIDTLPDAQRLVVNFWSAGFRYAEIAELLARRRATSAWPRIGPGRRFARIPACGSYWNSSRRDVALLLTAEC